MKNNPVFQVLVVGNTTLLAAGNGVTDLAVGQLGVFNAETNLSIDPNGAFPDRIYFAVGLPDASGNLGDVRKSAGEYIRKALINRATSKAPVVESAQTTEIDFTGFVPAANKEYVLRFTFMNNDSMYMQGFNHPVKSFVVATGAVAPSLNAFINLWVAEIAKDPELLITGENVTSTKLKLTFAIEAKVTALGGLNPKYRALRPYAVKTAIGGDFVPANYTLTEGAPVYAQGSGYDIQQLEYLAGGWNGNPGVYRESDITSFIGYSTDVYADRSVNYWLLELNYEFESHSGGNLEYSNQLSTIIAIPNTASYYSMIAYLVDAFNAHNPVAGTIAAPVTTTTTTTAG